MDVSQNYISLIPPPKEKKKREIKPKAEKPDKQKTQIMRSKKGISEN